MRDLAADSLNRASCPGWEAKADVERPFVLLPLSFCVVTGEAFRRAFAGDGLRAVLFR